MNQDDVLHKMPMLQCKISDFDMTRTIGGTIVIDNTDRRVNVFVDGSRLILSVSQFMKNETQIFCDFRGSVCGDKFGFRGALHVDPGFPLRLPAMSFALSVTNSP